MWLQEATWGLAKSSLGGHVSSFRPLDTVAFEGDIELRAAVDGMLSQVSGLSVSELRACQHYS